MTDSTATKGGYASVWFRYIPLLKRLLAFSCATVAGSAAYAQGVPDTIAQRALACAACHGQEGRATNDAYFPRIAGKPAGYLYNQLLNFRDGRRQYPPMTYLLDHLSDAYLLEFAQYFAGQHPPYPPPQPASVPAAAMEQGKRLVMSGDAARKLPACIACHGDKLTGVVPAIPSLLGLPRDYLNAQFGAWRNGVRRAAPPDCMAQIAKQLSIEEVSAVSAWLASQPVPNGMRPASAAAGKSPIPCGGVPQ